MLIDEIDTFYNGSAVNMPLPIAFAVIYNRMKLAGASKQELDDYLKLVMDRMANLASQN